MKQFDVFKNPVTGMVAAAPFVVVLTSEFVDLPAVLAAPLLKAPDRAIQGVDVPVRFDGQELTTALLLMAAIDPRRLRNQAGSLLDQEDQLRRGLDRLFTGF